MTLEDPFDPPPKSNSLMLFIVAIIVISLMAVGGGWFMGSKMASNDTIEAKDAANKEFDRKSKGDRENAESGETSAFFKSEKDVIELDTILVALRDSNKVWVRMRLAIVATDDADLGIDEVKFRMASDITAFVKTLTLKQISGPSGFVHLKEDLLDRARLSTDGQVEDLLIMSLVAE